MQIQIISHHDFPLVTDDKSEQSWKIKQNIDMWLVVARDAMSDNTITAYKQDWAIFCEWCEMHSAKIGYAVSTLPATTDTLLSFIDDVIGKRAPASINRCLSTVSKLHDVSDVKNPLNHVLVKTAKRRIGRGLKREKQDAYEHAQFIRQQYENERFLPENERTISEKALPMVGVDICHHNFSGQQRQASPITRADLRAIKKALAIKPLCDLTGLNTQNAKSARRFNAIQLKRARDLALIHLAYDSLLRVSELVRVTYEDFTWGDDNSATLSIGQRKDSREGEIAQAYITRESGFEIKRWSMMANIYAGPVICGLRKGGQLRRNDYDVQAALKPNAVLTIYKEMCDAIGLDSRSFSCHSTRVGAAQDMHAANINMPAAKLAGRWKSDVMPSRYMMKGEAKRGAMAQMEKLED